MPSNGLKRSHPITFIGIDPGATGGIAVICGASVACVTMPRTEQSVWDYIRDHIPSPQETVGGIEQVGGYIKGNPAPGSAMFEFGEIYGNLRMALVCAGLKLTKGYPGLGQAFVVTPQTWQSGLRIDPKRKGEADSDWKGRLKWNAEELFPKTQYPNLKITLRTADALLIALFIKREYTGIT